MKPFSCAIVGATGMVGRMFIEVLEEYELPVSQLYPFASARSVGKTVRFNDQDIVIQELTPESFDRGIDVALFAVDDEISRTYAPIAVAKGCIVIDNSSAWRMEPDVPLVVPEVNRADILGHRGIIANPNCCAVPAAMVLKPLDDAHGVERVVISTYQSVSGAGVAGMRDLDATLAGEEPSFFPSPIAHNIIPHIGSFDEDGYTGEETKIMAEVKKMLHRPDLKITATAVRVPVYTCHCLCINVALKKPFDMKELWRIFSYADGVVLLGGDSVYPTPRLTVGSDNAYIGRLRRDTSVENGINMWVVADNTRKGAAGNAVQILEALAERNI